MQIQYVSNGMKRNVRESVGNALIARRIARPVVDIKAMEPELEMVDVEISPRTGKPKRKYKRRDMVAEI